MHNEWTTLKDALIKEFKTQTPLEELLGKLYCTPFKGNLYLFCEQLKDKSTLIINKLAFEDDRNNTTVLHKQWQPLKKNK